MQGAAHDATYQGLGLRSYEGDFTDMHQFGGPVIKCLVHGSRNMDTLRADAVLLERALAAGMPLGGFRTEADFERALIKCFQDGAILLRGTPDSDDPDRPGVGKAWSKWLLARSRDNAPGGAPAQRIRDVLMKEVRARHAGGMIRVLMSAVDTVREPQQSSGDENGY